MKQKKNLLDIEDNAEVYAALKAMPTAPKNIILPQCLSSVLYLDSNAELNIIDFPDQVKISLHVSYSNFFNSLKRSMARLFMVKESN